ncbi:MAG: hypothetical protein J0L66_01360 [Cytophagales bacterium]|nr:hypothetical protein [Cytophagales bacterium]
MGVFNRKTGIYSVLLVALLAACLVAERWRNQADADYVARIAANLQSELTKLESEAQEIVKHPQLVWSTYSGAHFWVTGSEVRAWSQHDFVPDARMLADSNRLQYAQNVRGDFVVLRTPIAQGGTLVSMLPLFLHYPVTNRYLAPKLNASVFNEWVVRVLPPEAPTGEAISMHHEVLFKVLLLERAPRLQLLPLVLAIAAFSILILMVFQIIVRLSQQRKYVSAFLVLSGSFVLVRLTMVYWRIPARWWPSRIFNPQEFASANYNASIGDLVLNSLGVLLICAFVFYTYPRWQPIKNCSSLRPSLKTALGVVFLLVALFSFLYPFLFVETIFHNSLISLDITETLSVNALRSFAFISLLFGTVSSFFFTHVFVRLARFVLHSNQRFAVACIGALVLFVTYFYLEERAYWITVAVGLPYLILIYTARLNFVRRTFISFLYLFIALIAYGAQHALSVKRFAEERRIESQFRFARSYLIDRDVMAEFLLNESSKRIKNDAFIQTRLFSPFLSKAGARQKIKQVHLSSYFDRYEVEIHLFNAAREPVDEQSSNRWPVWEREMQPDVTTEYEGIYFVRSASVESGNRYLVMVPLQRTGQQIGYIVLELTLKRTIPQSVYPELLIDSRFAEFFENRDKSFAFISEGRIQSSFGNFNYERDFDLTLLQDPELFREGLRDHQFVHTAVEDESGRVAVVSARAYSYFFVLTNFSFYFVLCVAVLALVITVAGIVSWVQGRRITYATRIQLYIYLAFAVPLAIVAVTTLNRVSNSAEVQLTQEYISKARLLGENLLPAMLQVQTDEGRRTMEEQLAQASRFTQTDVSIFDARGKLLVSTQPVIAEGLLTSGLINRVAWERIAQGDVVFSINDKIGQLTFNNVFFVLRSAGSPGAVGIISLPFFESVRSLDATQITVLANILTIFTIIFLVFSLLSFYVVQSLTFPLRFITRTLSRTTLTGNKPLEWQSADEIGLMVSEYNKMVENLEQSKIELSRSQKESAWREIARQVAHEIKNPLTPMKLTLQQMQLWLAKDSWEKERGRQSVSTLLSQVEILNEIASSFSAFARMPAPILERVEVVALVTKTVNLYASSDLGKVALNAGPEPIFIMGDPQLLDRIFSNLILNGLQAGAGGATVEVSVQNLAEEVVVSVQDKGAGIPTELREKIFQPYFTTKKSGSGLGLAIARQGIELSGGRIWFESEPGRTVFYVAFPKT